MRDDGLSIGEASRRSGVKISTIRFYEEIGLLPAPERSEGNRRLFDPEGLRRLRFIRHARELGFEVEDIRELLTLADQPLQSCHPADHIAQRHLEAVEQKIARLEALREELSVMVQACRHGSVSECHVIRVLADHGECTHETH